LILSLFLLTWIISPAIAKVNDEIVIKKLVTLENQAQKLYENGEFQPAITILKDAINNYQKQDNWTGQIIAWRNLGLVYQKMGNPQEAKQSVAESIKYLAKITDNKKRQELFAKTLEVQGQIQLSIGDSQASLDTWKQIINIYDKSGDSTGLMRTKINESQSLQGLGLYNQAVKNLTATKLILDKQPDTLLKAKALLTLGNVLRGVRKLDESTQVLNQSLTIAEKLASNSPIITEILISLGKTQRLKLNSKQAINYYQQAVQKSPSSDLLIQAYLNQIDLLLFNRKILEFQVLVPKIQDTLTKLPASRSAVYARITFAKTILKDEEITKEYQNLIVQELATALNLSQQLADNRAESYALGVLGNIYEKNQRYPEAQKLTEKAVLIAQRIKAPDISYKWQWQLGRILAATENQKDAISAYQQTVKTLKNIRNDLVAISSDLQFSFREDVEPVYRELAGLLLHENSSQAEIKEARQVIEDLQLAELDNFFRNACLNSKSVEIDKLNDPTTAVFYTLILKERLEVIVALPNQPPQKYSQAISQVDIERSIKELKRELTNARGGSKKRLKLSQQIYNWLINKELATKLEYSKIKNLVFISDGVFRSIPLAALYDGKQYLIEKYSIALAPSLQLVDIKPLFREQIKLLAGGISEARQKFDALPNVVSELAQIKTQFPLGNFLKNESFTTSGIENNIKQYPAQIVHLATHGQFSSKAEDTFILTWDNQLNIDQLTNILRSDKKQIRPIELLVLSACQTASGDKRATLGLAGIAVKAGARSTIASLWSVDDQATSLLMTKLYQELSNGKITKSEALRRAQLSVLKQDEFKHPYFWSAFVLIGNWL
jgi:CHAT domain-containing protein